MTRMHRLILSVLLLGVLLGCDKPSEAPALAFYHWQTELGFTEKETEWLSATHSSRLYVKFFDLARQVQELVPLAKLQVPASVPDSLEIVPTIFITNASMLLLREQQAADATAIPTLVDRCHRLLTDLWPGLDYPEIQFDCDWTGQTRATFFAFLRQWRRVLPPQTTLSATLRLHQYRYPTQTGIPPVDRVMLMYYNVGQLEDWTEENSILNLATARAYLDARAYPLPIDLALPLFRWGVLFREGQVHKLITNLAAERLRDSTYFAAVDTELTPFTDGRSSSRFMVKKSTYLDGYYLYAGDLLRLEAVDSTLLLDAARQWQQAGVVAPRHLAFYHLDETVLTAFTHKNLRDCARVWLAD